MTRLGIRQDRYPQKGEPWQDDGPLLVRTSPIFLGHVISLVRRRWKRPQPPGSGRARSLPDIAPGRFRSLDDRPLYGRWCRGRGRGLHRGIARLRDGRAGYLWRGDDLAHAGVVAADDIVDFLVDAAHGLIDLVAGDLARLFLDLLENLRQGRELGRGHHGRDAADTFAENVGRVPFLLARLFGGFLIPFIAILAALGRGATAAAGSGLRVDGRRADCEGQEDA